MILKYCFLFVVKGRNFLLFCCFYNGSFLFRFVEVEKRIFEKWLKICNFVLSDLGD